MSTVDKKVGIYLGILCISRVWALISFTSPLARDNLEYISAKTGGSASMLHYIFICFFLYVVRIAKSGTKGYGLFTNKDIEKGQVLISEVPLFWCTDPTKYYSDFGKNVYSYQLLITCRFRKHPRIAAGTN